MSTLIGQPAPDFTLEGIRGSEFIKDSLASYKGKWVVVFFYPLDFTGVCGSEVSEFNKRHGDFARLGAQVIGISVDSKFSHQRWAKELGEPVYPLLSDLTKETSRNYGVLLEGVGIATRGTFIIDPEGKVRYQVVHEPAIGRSVEETLRVLQALQSGEFCQAEWKPGQKTLGKK